jgi:hypothetical protein
MEFDLLAVRHGRAIEVKYYKHKAAYDNVYQHTDEDQSANSGSKRSAEHAQYYPHYEAGAKKQVYHPGMERRPVIRLDAVNDASNKKSGDDDRIPRRAIEEELLCIRNGVLICFVHAVGFNC